MVFASYLRGICMVFARYLDAFEGPGGAWRSCRGGLAGAQRSSSGDPGGALGRSLEGPGEAKVVIYTVGAPRRLLVVAGGCCRLDPCFSMEIAPHHLKVVGGGFWTPGPVAPIQLTVDSYKI